MPSKIFLFKDLKAVRALSIFIVLLGSILATPSWSMDKNDVLEKTSLTLAGVPSANIEEMPDEEGYYIAQDYETDRLYCVRVKDKEEELDGYRLVFEEDLTPPLWSVNQYNSLKDAEDTLKIKEIVGVYDKINSFTDYNIYLKGGEDDNLIGRIGLLHRCPSDNRLEVSYYISNKHRGKGYATEANKGLIENVVMPGLGQPFRMVGTNHSPSLPECDNTATGLFPWMYNKLTFVSKRPNFKGVEAIIDLDNSASLCASLAAGYFPILRERDVLIYAPSLHNKCMGLEDMSHLKKIAAVWNNFAPTLKENKISHTHYFKKISSLEEKNNLKQLYMGLLNTEEPFTFYHTLSFLLHDLNVCLSDINLNEKTAISTLEEFLESTKTLDLGAFLGGFYGASSCKYEVKFLLNQLQTQQSKTLAHKRSNDEISSQGSEETHTEKRKRHNK